MKSSAAFRVAFTGGGTGGHIYPALAIDDAIRAEYDPGHYEPRFFGNRHGLEAQLVTTMPLTFVPSAALQRKLSIRTLFTVLTTLLGVIVALGALRRFRPLMVVATGGYVCFPVVVAARILRTFGQLHCGIALLQIDVTPGLTNRLLAPIVDEVWTTYDASAPYFRGKAHRTGTPVRASLTRKVHPSRARLELGLAPERATVVAMGGSLGARSVNEAVAALVTRRTLGDDRQVLHVSGERDHAYMEAEERDVGVNHVMLVPYLADPGERLRRRRRRDRALRRVDLGRTGRDRNARDSRALSAPRRQPPGVECRRLCRTRRRDGDPRRRARRRSPVVDARCDAAARTAGTNARRGRIPGVVRRW